MSEQEEMAGGNDGGGDGDNGRAGSDGNRAEAGFLSTLPEDLRSDPSLSQFDSLEALAREHSNVQKLIGRKGVVVPKDGDGDDVVANFRQAIGVPETADQYDLSAFEAPEGFSYSEERQKSALDGLHKLGLTQQQVVGVMNLHAADIQAAVAEAGFVIENRDELLSEFDTAYPQGSQKRKEAMADLQRGFSMLGLPDVGDIDQISKRVGSKKLMEVAMKVGQLSTDDGQIVTGKTSGRAAPEDQVKAYRAEIAADPKHPYNNPRHPEYKAAQKRMTDLYAAKVSERGDQ